MAGVHMGRIKKRKRSTKITAVCRVMNPNLVTTNPKLVTCRWCRVWTDKG